MLEVTAIGNLAAAPELRYTQSGQEVTNFRIACRAGKDKDGEPNTEWGNQAIACHEYLNRGDKVAVSGPLSTRQYTTKEGRYGFALEMRASSIEFVSTKNREASNDDEAQQPQQQPQQPPQQPTQQRQPARQRQPAQQP